MIAERSNPRQPRIFHADDGAPFVGARVRLGGVAVFTDESGTYRFISPPVLGDQVLLIDGNTNNRSGPTRLDSSRGVYKCNPGDVRVIHGGTGLYYSTPSKSSTTRPSTFPAFSSSRVRFTSSGLRNSTGVPFSFFFFASATTSFSSCRLPT